MGTKRSVSRAAVWMAMLAAAVCALLLAAPKESSAAGSEALVVIVNSSNPVDNVTMSDLRKLFLSERDRWETGKSVAPVLLTAGQPERVAFLKEVCGMSDADFSNYFVKAEFAGKSATPPREVGSAREVKSVVASSPGGIGFVRASELHGDSSDGGVKAVKVDGLSASDPGYKLKG
jgi:ABC-type phosphate transport system substrate-binding protein